MSSVWQTIMSPAAARSFDTVLREVAKIHEKYGPHATKGRTEDILELLLIPRAHLYEIATALRKRNLNKYAISVENIISWQEEYLPDEHKS